MRKRHEISFDLDNEDELIAHEFLKLCSRKQGKVMAELVRKLLLANRINDISKLSKEEAVIIAFRETSSEGYAEKFLADLTKAINAQSKSINENKKEDELSTVDNVENVRHESPQEIHAEKIEDNRKESSIDNDLDNDDFGNINFDLLNF